MIKKHNKLVRDNIIKIIEDEHKKCKYITLDDSTYLKELYRKLNEEHEEFNEAYSIEELADMQEVIDAIVSARGYSKTEFQEIQEKKSTRNGKFEDKLYLIEVEDNE